MSVLHLSQGRQVRFRGDTIVRTSAMRATPSQERIAIAKVVGAKAHGRGKTYAFNNGFLKDSPITARKPPEDQEELFPSELGTDS